MFLIEYGNFGEYSKIIWYLCLIKNVWGYILGMVLGCIENNLM